MLWCCNKLKRQKYASDHLYQCTGTNDLDFLNFIACAIVQSKDCLRKSDSFKVLWQHLVFSHSGRNNLADCCSRFL